MYGLVVCSEYLMSKHVSVAECQPVVLTRHACSVHKPTRVCVPRSCIIAYIACKVSKNLSLDVHNKDA